MKTNTKDVLEILTSTAMLIFITIMLCMIFKQKNKDYKEYSDKIVYENPIDDSIENVNYCFELQMNALVKAFSYVESRNNPKAVNDRAVGLLQITPIMVKQVNKISETKYTLEDRLDSIKSVEMFKIIMKKYNPLLDCKTACDVWNPKHSKRYFDSIEDKFLNYYFTDNE